MASIVRKITFDAGHRVYGHEGKCNHLHGHTYTAEIMVSAYSLDSVGRVVDFSVIKDKVGGWINQWWDHNLLLNERDPLAGLFDEILCAEGMVPVDMQQLNGRAPYRMPCNPTAENMARILFDVASSLLESEGLRINQVKLWETPNCFAIYPEVPL